MPEPTGHQDLGRSRGLGSLRQHVGALAPLLALFVLGGCDALAQNDDVSLRLTNKLDEILGDVPGPIRYFAKQVDLDGDGRAETIVHVAGPMVCGTGGCDTFVLTQEGQEFRLVSRISVTRPPIAVASTATHGWRDLVVRVSGGGVIPGYDARLRFDGTTYPDNPTVPPAQPLKGPVSGELAIPVFESFTEGRLLRADAK